MCAQAEPTLLDEDLLRWFYGGTPPDEAPVETTPEHAADQPDDALVA